MTILLRSAVATPRTFLISAFQSPKASVGTWTLALSTARFFTGGLSNGATTGGQNDYLEHDISLVVGTYTFDLFHNPGTHNGILTVQLDGTTVGTIDTYNASTAARKDSIAGIVVATSGSKTLRLILATKNASSDSYRLDLGAFGFTRTGA